MADFAPNFTARYRARYQVAGKSHKFMIRIGAGGTFAEASASGLSYAQTLLTTLAPLLWADFTVLSAEAAEKDSDLFFPCAAPTVTGAIATTGRPTSAAAMQGSFVGRTAGGLRWIMFMYGLAFNPVQLAGATDFRVAYAENATLAAATDAIGGTFTAMVGNDGLPVNVYPYTNVKYNDYWTKRLRNG